MARNDGRNQFFDFCEARVIRFEIDVRGAGNPRAGVEILAGVASRKVGKQ
jgi:hypothetical protein